MRGIGQVNWGPTQDPKVGTYVDGVYLARPQGAIFDLLDIERVEVLRGPQGTLFGRNTTAGLVQVITQKPHGAFEGTLLGGVGNDGQVTTGALVNLPMGDTLAGRLALQTRKADGWMEDNGGREWNTTDSRSGRFSVLWTPNDSIYNSTVRRTAHEKIRVWPIASLRDPTTGPLRVVYRLSASYSDATTS